MTATSGSLIGLGLYSRTEAAQLLGLDTPSVRRWAEGYTFRSRGRKRFSPPVIRTQLQEAHGAGILTFLDLMELKFVAIFRSHRVSMRVIRDAAAEAVRLFKPDHPFAFKRFHTGGKSIFAAMVYKQRRSMQELHRGQLVFESVAQQFFKQLDFALDETVLKYWPLGKKKRIVLDPQRAFGKPIHADTGVPTFALYEAMQSGEPLERVAAWYEVPVAAVASAVEYEEHLLAM